MHAHVNDHCRGYFYVQFYLFDWFLAMLGLHCWAGFSLVTVLRLLLMVASLVAEHGLSSVQASAAAACGLRTCGSWAPGHSLSQLWDTGLAFLQPVGSSQTRDWSCVPRTERRTLHHWTNQEASLCPSSYFSPLCQETCRFGLALEPCIPFTYS